MIERLRYDDHDEAANEIERLRLVEGRALAAKHHDDEEVRLIIKWVLDGENIERSKEKLDDAKHT